MVIECIGLPGSGKSYLFRQVEEELARKGIPCVNASELCMHSLPWKAAKKVLHRTIFLDRSARSLRERMKRILAEDRQGGAAVGEAEQGGPAAKSGEACEQGGPLRSRYGINKDERFTVESAAIFAAAYRRMEKSDKVYLFDEGLVHTIVKFCAEFHLSDKVFLEMMAVCGPFRGKSRIVVHNEISIEDCMQSIQQRNRHICAFDELPADKLRDLLGEYSRLNACYAANYPVLAVSRAENEEEKCTRVCEEISGRRV